MDKLYLVEDIADFCDCYHIFDNKEKAQKYIKDHIKQGLVDYNRDIKVLTLTCITDLQNLKYEIPWEYIKNNYNLNYRFISEFEEYF
jgi:hypothetical protein